MIFKRLNPKLAGSNLAKYFNKARKLPKSGLLVIDCQCSLRARFCYRRVCIVPMTHSSISFHILVVLLSCSLCRSSISPPLFEDVLISFIPQKQSDELEYFHYWNGFFYNFCVEINWNKRRFLVREKHIHVQFAFSYFCKVLSNKFLFQDCSDSSSGKWLSFYATDIFLYSHIHLRRIEISHLNKLPYSVE